MIGSFPSPFEDELLYSILARFHKRSGNEAIKHTVKDLYGKVKCAVVDFPCNISKLSEYIPLKNFDVMNIIQKHTLLPYYKPFVSVEDYERFVDIMSSEYSNNKIHMVLGLPANLVKNYNYLRYCESCCNDDIKLYRLPYWHRVHQLPGVIVCPFHKCSLIQSEVKFYERENRQEFLLLNRQGKNLNNMIISKYEQEFFEYISEQSLFLLRDSLLLPTVEKVNEFIRGQLEQQKFLTFGGRIKFKTLIPYFREAFPDETLKKIGLNLCELSEETWLHKILRQKGNFHPLKYLTVMFFFNRLSIKDITDYNIEKQLPFGAPPYPCLNKVSQHYKKTVIEKVDVSIESKTKMLVGTFSCKCGFIYSRRGPDKVKEDRLKIGRIKEFGWEWKEKLAELNKKEGLSLRRIAKEMGTDVKTIKKYSKIETIGEIDKDGRIEKKVVNKKSANKRLKKKLGVDWEIRDQNLAKSVFNTSKQILSKEKGRVTKSRIGRMLGVSSLIDKKLKQLPLTRIVLIIISESVEDYQKRRVFNVCTALKAQGFKIRLWEVKRLAGLKSLTPSLTKHINSFLELE
jgi:transcriptional regulator with XRE-family HTH domain